LFDAIRCHKAPKLKTLAQKYCSLLDKNDSSTPFGKTKATALLCLDWLFADKELSQLALNSEDGVLQSLDLFSHYAQLMQQLSCHSSPWLVDSILNLFALSRAGEDDVEVHNHTFAYHITRYYRDNASAQQRATVRVSNRAFLCCFQAALCQRLRDKVKLEEEHMHRVKVFQPCFSLVATGRCHSQHNYPMAHDLDAKWFNKRARFYLLQIIILHSIHTIPRCEEFPERIKQRR